VQVLYGRVISELHAGAGAGAQGAAVAVQGSISDASLTPNTSPHGLSHDLTGRTPQGCALGVWRNRGSVRAGSAAFSEPSGSARRPWPA
jgi:hypothetical protein